MSDPSGVRTLVRPDVRLLVTRPRRTDADVTPRFPRLNRIPPMLSERRGLKEGMARVWRDTRRTASSLTSAARASGGHRPPRGLRHGT